MNVFWLLVTKLIPLYLLIILGYVAGRKLKIDKSSIAPILIYLIAPVVVFNGVVTTPISWTSMAIPVIVFTIGSVSCLLFYILGKFFWKDTTRNILAFTAGAGNTGYFGLPVAMAVFDKSMVGMYILGVLGVILYENTLGFFITARGNYSFRESIKKVLKLPTVYAYLLGLFCNLIKLPLGQIYTDNIVNFKGAYTILGMMLIGLGLTGIQKLKIDFKFIGLTLVAKYLVWPMLMLVVIWIDGGLFRLINQDVNKVLILISIVPLAANTVAYATELKAQPEKAATAVLISTILALGIIPLASMLWF